MSKKNLSKLVTFIVGIIFFASLAWSFSLEAFLKAKTPTLIAWSPDGSQIAYQISSSQNSEIRLYSLSNKDTKVLISGSFEHRYFKESPDLRWTPDGQSIVYSSGRNYYTISCQGGEPELLIGGFLMGDLVTLSPDLKKMSFIHDGDFWVQNVEGGAPYRITQGEDLLRTDLDLLGPLLQKPQWSPDSTKIAFVSPMMNGYKVGIISIEEKRTTWISPEEDRWMNVVTWSPDSQKIAIARLSNDYTCKQLWVANVSGDKVYNLWKETDDSLSVIITTAGIMSPGLTTATDLPLYLAMMGGITFIWLICGVIK